MRNRIAVVVIAAACGHPADKPGATTPPVPVSKQSAKPQDDAPKGEIVTKEVVAMNADAKPIAQFRTGSVNPIASPEAKKTATGYQVVFGTNATITTPTVYDRKVIVSGGFRGTQLFAYEATTGKAVWGVDLHDDGPSSPACDRGACVIATESCTLFALDAATGKQLWSYWLGDPLTSAPTIAGDRVFASYPASQAEGGKPVPTGANHVLAAFDLHKGTILWQLWLDGDVMSAPVAVGDFVYVTTFAGTVIKLEQATGKVRYAMKAKATSAPVVMFDGDGVEQMYYTRREEDAKAGASEMIIRADHNEPETRYKAAEKKAPYVDHQAQQKSGYAAKAKADDAHNGFGSGAPASAAANFAEDSVGVGSVASMQGFQGSRVLHLADRNVNTMGDEVIATDTETGATLWSAKLSGDLGAGGFLGTAPLAAGGSVLVGTLEGKVLRLDPANGRTAKTYEVGGPIRSQPVVDGGWIYVGTEDGKLVAIDTKDASITGWPTWGGNAQRTGISQTRPAP
jgi:outer membrane protein assembly factor BamB